MTVELNARVSSLAMHAAAWLLWLLFMLAMPLILYLKWCQWRVDRHHPGYKHGVAPKVTP